MFEDLDWEDVTPLAGRLDPVESDARDSLLECFERNRQRVYFSRQLEVQNEDRYFHWITTASRRTQKAECGNHGEVSAQAYRSVNSGEDSHGLNVKSLSPNSATLPP